MINNNNNTDRYWKKYNLSKNKLIKKIIKHNNKFEYNFLENEHFNHTRDLFALSLVNLKKSNDKIKVLDFGSNLLTLANLNNKINTKNYQFTIFDPFLKNNTKNIKIKNVKYELIKNKKKILKKAFRLIHFASSIQYQKNFLKEIENFNFKKTEIVIFTYTPFSLKKTYYSQQSNHLNLVQNVYSLKELIFKLKKMKFNLIFKSRNEDRYISCKKKQFKTLSLNLVFQK